MSVPHRQDSSSAPLPLCASLLSALPFLQRELRPKPVELSPTLLGTPQSHGGSRPFGWSLSTSTTAASWGGARGARPPLRSPMGKARGGRGRPLAMQPYREGERGALPASAASTLWGRSARERRRPPCWLGDGGDRSGGSCRREWPRWRFRRSWAWRDGRRRLTQRVRSPIGLASSTLSTPPSEKSRGGPVALYWAVAFFWYGVELAQISTNNTAYGRDGNTFLPAHFTLSSVSLACALRPSFHPNILTYEFL
jgi:hypothetical protein